MSHRKSLSRQHARRRNAFKQAVLVQRRQQKADAARLTGKPNQRIVAMNIVQLPRALLQVFIQEFLQNTDWELSPFTIQMKRSFSMLGDILNPVPITPAAELLQLLEQVVYIRMLHNPVDRFKLL